MNRFQRMVIHDLRGPATSIQLGSDLALKGVKQMLRSNFKQINHYASKVDIGRRNNISRSVSNQLMNVEAINIPMNNSQQPPNQANKFQKRKILEKQGVSQINFVPRLIKRESPQIAVPEESMQKDDGSGGEREAPRNQSSIPEVLESQESQSSESSNSLSSE